MFVKKSGKGNKTFLSFVQGYRSGGVVKHKTIEGLGYLVDLQKIYDNPIDHFRDIAKTKNISNEIENIIKIKIDQRLDDNTAQRKNLGYAVAKRIYSTIGLHDFFNNKQRHLNIEYNLDKIFRLLVFNRFMFPSSKKKAFDESSYLFEDINFSLDDIYRSLTFFSKYSEEIQAHVNKCVLEMIERQTDIGYYDVTNYYFEIPYNDEDIFDDDGRLIKKGFRKKGPSKEHRPDPIVQMGLLMDNNGIPMAFNTFSGSESEKTSMLPIIRRVKRDYGIKRIIAVADRGLNSSDNTLLLSGLNNNPNKIKDGYIYGQSILVANKEFKKWVIDKDSYIISNELNRNGKYFTFTHKSRVYAKSIKLKNSNGIRNTDAIVYQKQLVYYSDKYAHKQRKERDIIIAKAKDMLSNPTKYTKATSFGATKYIKNLKFNKKTGEVLNGNLLLLNTKKIEEEKLYDGFYSIVTSELNLSDISIFNTYRGLWEIEESFKIIKSEFKARPIYLRSEDHINAHFLICFISLLIMRILQFKLNKTFSFHQIRQSLIKYSCSNIEQNYYLFDYRDEILIQIEKIFNIDLGKKIMKLSQIKEILQTTSTYQN